MTALALALCGYSVFAALAIALTHHRSADDGAQALARGAGLGLLGALAGLQIAHFALLYADIPWVYAPGYRLLLFLVAPSFFLYSRPLLDPAPQAPARAMLPGHALPILVAPWLPDRLTLPGAFALGACYLIWLARKLYGLRTARSNFRTEFGLLGAVFAIAVIVAVLGVLRDSLPGRTFYSLYALAIGMAFLLIQTVLGLRPRLSAEVQETARAAYAVSTLGGVDCMAALARLEALMDDHHLYTEADLGLADLARRLGLSSHQTSELLNARLGRSFARYLREKRVAGAMAMLLAEPSASVLSVGLSVGFTSQSNFYEAFREIAGTTPGTYRKLHGGARPA